MFLHNHLSNNFCCACIHAREPRTVLEQCSDCGSVAVDEGTHYITLVYREPFFTAINFHDDVFRCNYHLGIVVQSGTIGAFKFKTSYYQPISGWPVGLFMCTKCVHRLMRHYFSH